jgi:Cdc6-like AAA superfamily ATPase
MAKPLKELIDPPESPRTDEEWRHLEYAIQETFSPHSPIDQETLFAGRYETIDRIIDTVFQRGRHAILYGERGVGKTSLANIIKDKIFTKTATIKVIKRNCTNAHNFRLIWQHALDDYIIDGKGPDKFLGKNPNPYDIYKILELLPKTERQIFIFDEFDRIRDQDTFTTMADTIKYLADYHSRATVIIVGVADSVTGLFGGHPSIQRNVQQIRVPRMSASELTGIIDKRMPILGMHMNQKTINLTIELSQGLPAYTHLIGQNSAVAAAKRHSVEITTVDFDDSIGVCISEADETVRETYLKAVRSTKPTNKYKEALLACALAKGNDKGYFSAAGVRDAYTKIKEMPVDIPYFARHIKAFCHTDRGPALEKVGNPKSYEYRFTDPLIRPYTVICGMAEKMIRRPT